MSKKELNYMPLQVLRIEEKRLNVELTRFRWDALSKIRHCIRQLEYLPTGADESTIVSLLGEYEAVAMAIESISPDSIPKLEMLDDLHQRLQSFSVKLATLGQGTVMDTAVVSGGTAGNDQLGQLPAHAPRAAVPERTGLTNSSRSRLDEEAINDISDNECRREFE